MMRKGGRAARLCTDGTHTRCRVHPCLYHGREQTFCYLFELFSRALSMKYLQVHTSRLSSAAEKLVRDGAWHVYETDSSAWYRVLGKVVQRVRLEAGEDPALLGLFDRLAPLPKKVFKEGFREELTLRIDDDAYALCGMYLRSFIGWDLLARAGERIGVSIRFHAGNSIEFSVAIPEWTTRELLHALVTARAFAQVGSSLVRDAREGIPHTEKELRGLLRTARELLLEDIGDLVSENIPPVPAAPKRRGASQPTLFTDSPDEG